MYEQVEKSKENKSKAVANSVAQKKSGGEYPFQFVNNRPEAIAQRKLQEMVNDSPRVKQLKSIESMSNNSLHAKLPTQLQSIADNNSVQQQQPIQKKENNTGLPDNLKSGIENLSGYSMDDVKVHRNSDKPALLQAHAYAQGTDIHLASGLEKHLPHEAWHIVQQKQGRVKPTMQMKGNVDINDNAGLEREADVMGAQALGLGAQLAQQSTLSSESLQRRTVGSGEFQSTRPVASPAGNVAQLTVADLNAANVKWTQYNNTHGTVHGIVTGDITRLQAAYAHYLLPINGGLNDTAADAANSFLKNSVTGLLHDVEEIDSHSGGYYFQQVVKNSKNAAVNVINQVGARGGVSNLRDPDLIVQQGVGGSKDAIEVKRTTTENGAATLLDGALEQLSLRKGYANASVSIEVTHPTQAANIIGNLGAVDTRIKNKVNTLSRGFGRNYWNSTQAIFFGILRQFTLTVCIRSAVPGAAAVVYDRDFNIIIDQNVGRRGTTYTLIAPTLSTTRV